jgi:2-dehydropantoate 2-reductase
MKIAIVGSGALGLYYGAMLARGGNDVRFLLRSDYDAIMAQGLTVRSAAGDFHLTLKGYRHPGEIGTVDLVIIGLKTFANDRFAELITPLVGSETAILTLQNGLGNEEALAELFGADRVLGGVAYLAANRGAPGELLHLGEGRIVLGEFASHDVARAEEIAATFVAAGVSCRATPDLMRARWEKLVWNIPFNGICAVVQQPVDRLLATKEPRQLVRQVMLEVIAAANAQGGGEPLATDYADRLLTFSETLGPYKPSMQIDRELGRPLELRAIFAIPLRRGGEQGVDMPRVTALHTLLTLGEKSGG